MSYTPTARGPDSRTIAIFSNGLGSTDQNARTDQLVSGIGVGPVFDSSVASIDFGPVEVGTMATSPLQISNTTTDLNVSSDFVAKLSMTLTGFDITGPDSSTFELLGFTPGTLIHPTFFGARRFQVSLILR